VHGILKYLLSRASSSLYLNMFGYDDEELNQECMRCACDRTITTVITLDKSQSGGKHEKAILDEDPTGARAGEQIAFEWQDLDLHNKLVVFRRSSTNGIVGPTTSGKERKVPLTNGLEAALRSIRHMKGPRVFCNPDGKPTHPVAAP
jgi:hypothetical protein